MSLNDDSRAVLLNRDELAYVMSVMKTTRLLGIDPVLMEKAAVETGRQSLVWRGLVKEAQGKTGTDQLRGDLLGPALVVLKPQRALIVARTVQKKGTQLLIFLRCAGNTVLHTLPRPGMHRWIRLLGLEEGVQVLREWFPLDNHPVSDVNFLIASDLFDRFRAAAPKGKGEGARKLLDDLDVGDKDKAALTQALSKPVVSGSFALMTVNKGRITSAETLAVVADEKTAWAVTRPAGDSGGATYRVRRTGPDAPAIFTRMFTWLMG